MPIPKGGALCNELTNKWYKKVELCPDIQLNYQKDYREIQQKKISSKSDNELFAQKDELDQLTNSSKTKTNPLFTPSPARKYPELEQEHIRQKQYTTKSK